MSRDVSNAMRSAMFAQEADEVPICLLTITHDDLVEPFYFSSDPTRRISVDPLLYATASRGRDYLFLPFDFILPQDEADAPQRVKLTMSNADREMVSVVRSVSTPPKALVEVILAETPDLVEIAIPDLLMSEAVMSESDIVIELTADPLINEPYPGRSFTPGSFPGLF
ncbi:conserved hypothetical protein [Roseibium sp. TrichSKD4]|uniref:DUF1833 family protein n=1 Tax=Roseibium sp. TrichSKD4 TaxID=744980 RepID=UPI0001E56B92|nr:DUF1833 family protein [Roseibium sp. TrichSKD4]EFO32623.1 conserved hypothetical protein [Roseibium sp. TrichSKD4]